MMKTVKALTSFDHGGDRRPGSQFDVTNITAAELEKAGLVEIISDVESEDEPPAKGNGKPRSKSGKSE